MSPWWTRRLLCPWGRQFVHCRMIVIESCRYRGNFLSLGVFPSYFLLQSCRLAIIYCQYKQSSFSDKPKIKLTQRYIPFYASQGENGCKSKITPVILYLTLYNLNCMGVKQSKSAEILKYIEKEWEYLKTNKGGIKIYRNRYTDNEAELHTIGIEQKMNLQKQYDIYNYRRTQDNALVSVYAVQNLKDTAPNLCGNRNVLKVMVESIPWRLRDLPKLSLRQSIYVLSQAIRGYDDCYSKVGQFDISDQMIGLNSTGKVKVWLTQFFGQNHPSDQKPILQITTANELRTRAFEQQQSMLRQVLTLVQRKCRQRYPAQLSTQLQNQTAFADAYHCIQEYCLQNQLEIPDRIILQNINVNEQSNSVHHLNFQPQPNNPTNVQKSNFSFQNSAGKGTLIKQLSFQNNFSSPKSTFQVPNLIQNPNIRTNTGPFDPFYSTGPSNNTTNNLQYKDRSQFATSQGLGFINPVNTNQLSSRPGGVNFSYPQTNLNPPSRQAYYSRGFTQF